MYMLFYFIACGGAEKMVPVCTADEVPSIVLHVYDEEGNLITPDEVVWSLDGGTPQVTPCPGGYCNIGSEQSGEFKITVYYRSEFAVTTVSVATDECHVMTEQVDIVIPSDFDPCEQFYVPDEFGNYLDVVLGCEDVSIYALDSQQQATSLLSFWTPDLAQQALDAGESLLVYRNIGDEVMLTANFGDNLEQGICAATTSAVPSIDVSFSGISGVAEITIVPLENGSEETGMGLATVLLLDAVMVESEVGECVIPLGNVFWEDILVGWKPE